MSETAGHTDRQRDRETEKGETDKQLFRAYSSFIYPQYHGKGIGYKELLAGGSLSSLAYIHTNSSQAAMLSKDFNGGNLQHYFPETRLHVY